MGLCLGKSTSDHTSSTSPPWKDLPHELAGISSTSLPWKDLLQELAVVSTSPPWKDLPHELAGVVLSRLASHDDCLSFGAVCQDWRLAARQQRLLLPPPMPCISLGKGEY